MWSSDQAGEQQIAGKILRRAPAASPSPISTMRPFDHGDPATLDHAIGENDAGIRQDDAGGAHDPSTAAAVNRATSTTVSAIAVAHLFVVHDRDDRPCRSASFPTPGRPRPRGCRRRGKRWARPEEEAADRTRSPRAMLTRCCSPPENVAGGSGQSRSGILSRDSRSAACCRGLRPHDACNHHGSATTSIAATRGTARRNWLT